MTFPEDITLRLGTEHDLDVANKLIEAAIMTWDLPERVKRLSLPTYRYQAHDLEHLTLILAESAGRLLGVTTWEPASPADVPVGRKGLLLHGLYVDPEHHGQGVGTDLLAAALQAARRGGFDGLLVKANKDAQGYFVARGLRHLPVAKPDRDYPYRYWYEFKERN